MQSANSRSSCAVHVLVTGKPSREGFRTRADAWRKLGRWVCRHGVFWLRAQGSKCPCMSPNVPTTAWRHARWMAAVDDELHALVAAPFDEH
eukprot:2422851-Karenia_brevis.AAC.1